MAGAPFGFGPLAGGPYSGLRRSVIDPVTGQPVVTSPPTGEVVQRASVLPIGRDDAGRLVPAVPGLAMQAVEAAKFPGQVYRGEASIFDPVTGRVSDEAVGKAFDLAGTAMTGSLPLKAPKGALRSFGGAAAKGADDLFADLEAGLAAATKDMTPEVTPRSFVDPDAKSWNLYHGTASPTDFTRFRTDLPQDMRPNTVGSPNQGQAVFLTPAPDEAAHYALGRGATGAGVEAGPRTIPVTVDPGKTGVLDMVELAQQPGFIDRLYAANIASKGNPTDPAQLRSIRNVVDLTHRSQLDQIASAKAFNEQYGHLGVSETPTYNYMGGGTDVALQMAREQGLDTAIIRGLSESNGGDQVVALTPGRVRSRYSGDLLYSGGPGGAGLGAAALAQPSGAQAAPFQGKPPVTASPFGFGPPQISPEDLARLFQAQAMGAPQGFVPQQAAPMPQAAPQAAPRRRPLSFGGQGSGSGPQAMTVPLPPQRPAEFGDPRADMPAEGAQAIMSAAQTQAPAAEEPSFLDRLARGIRSSDGLLTSIGMGLMSNANWGQGIAAGLQAHQQGEGRRAASRLAEAEYGLKVRELGRKERGENATRSFLLGKGLSADQADAAMANPTVLSSTMAQLNRDPSRVTIGGNVYELRPGERPNEGNLLGPAEADRDNTQIVDVPIGNGQVQKQVIKKGETSGPGIGVPVASGQSNVTAQIAERRAAVETMGLDPNEPRNRDYILSGKPPREDQSVLSASDKKTINAAEDELPGLDQTLSTLQRARELNRQTFTGSGANLRAQVGTRLPDGLVPDWLADPKGAEATREFGQIMSMEAIKSMSQTLKGATTDREMDRFMEILGDPTTPPDVRERTIDRMIQLTQRQQETARSRIEDMRGGTYYKPRGQNGGGQAAPGTPAQPQQPARDPLASARDALARGAPRDAVLKRLRDAGIDTAGL